MKEKLNEKYASIKKELDAWEDKKKNSN